MTNKRSLLRTYDEDLLKLATNIFGDELGKYYLTRVLMAKKVALDADAWESYLLSGKHPGVKTQEMRFFEKLRRRYEIELRRKVPEVENSVQFQILKRRLKEKVIQKND